VDPLLSGRVTQQVGGGKPHCEAGEEVESWLLKKGDGAERGKAFCPGGQSRRVGKKGPAVQRNGSTTLFVGRVPHRRWKKTLGTQHAEISSLGKNNACWIARRTSRSRGELSD